MYHNLREFKRFLRGLFLTLNQELFPVVDLKMRLTYLCLGGNHAIRGQFPAKYENIEITTIDELPK